MNRINKNNDNKSNFTSSVTSWFYRILKLGSNLQEINKDERNRDIIMLHIIIIEELMLEKILSL